MDTTANDQTVKVLKDKLIEEEGVYKKLDVEQRIRLERINSLRNTIELFTGETIAVNIENLVEKKDLPTGGQPEAEFDYPEKGSWKDRIIAYIKYKNRAILTNQLVKDFEKHEPTMDGKKILNIISGNMSTLVSEGIVKTYKPGKMKGYYYASPRWFDTEGNLMEEHKPITKEKTIW